mgnify:CR=1 FL=1
MSGNLARDEPCLDHVAAESGAATFTGNTLIGNGFKADPSDKFYHGAFQITGPNATVTDNTITDETEMEEHLAAIRERGYAVTLGDYASDASGFAAPIYDAAGEIPGGVDKVLPNGLVALIFNTDARHRIGKSARAEDNRVFERSWFTAMQTTPLYNAAEGPIRAFGVLFEAPGAAALFGVDQLDLADRTVDARAQFPEEFVELGEKVLARAEDTATHALLFDALLERRRAPIPPWLNALYATIVTCHGEVNLDLAYAAANVSAQEAEEWFISAVGVTPEAYCRLHRLQALLAAIDPAANVDWLLLARRFGFTDPATFAEAFHIHTGQAPEDYLAALRAPGAVQASVI